MMQSSLTGHVTPSEWRWVILVSCALVLLAFLPFLWVLVAGIADTEWRFMGALHSHLDGAANLSQLYQGSRDIWLTHYLHTPEPHTAALIDPLYVLLGQISRLTSLAPIVVFHVARVCASLAMYMAFYQLASTIWMRLRTRRIFFALLSVGSGFGWVLGPLMQRSEDFLDLSSPGVFPFYASLANVHFPLALACLALLASVVIIVTRPGNTPPPSVNNGGVMVFTLSLILVFVYPLAFVPIAAAFIANIAWHWIDNREISRAQYNWLLWFIVPALPMLLYYLLVLQNNVVVSAVWESQAEVASPNIIIMVLSFGLPLGLALPGLYRAFRRFDRDGDQFMLIWFVMILVLVYLPTMAQASFLPGIMIPLAYFATRATEDFWFPKLRRRWWIRSVVASMPILFASNLLVMILPLSLINGQNPDASAGILLQQEYVQMFEWLSDRVDADDVIMAAPETSLWIPSWTGARVVYGHPDMTLDGNSKRRAVVDWYRQSDPEACPNNVLQGDLNVVGGQQFPFYRVDYVIVGPQEREIGLAACRETLRLAAVFGETRVYINEPVDDMPAS